MSNSLHQAHLCTVPFDHATALADFTAKADGAGAIVSFTGLVRGEQGVHALTLQAHPRVTLASMQAILANAATRFAMTHSIALHRHGTIKVGEAVVFVAAAARHRRAAFEAADWIMNRLKTEAVFWKMEHRPDGDHWIEPTEADYAALETDHARNR